MSGQGDGAPRRVLLGIAEDQDLRWAVETAAALASGFNTGLQCLLVEHEDLLALAGLPFVRTFGRGGRSSPLTPEVVENHFRNIARSVERTLAISCTRAQVAWELARPRGEYLRELALATKAEDVVVVSRERVMAASGGALAAVRALLGKAAAVVMPAPRALQDGTVLALSGDGQDDAAIELADGIARALQARLDAVTVADFLASRRRAAVVVASVAQAEAAGEAAFFQRIDEAEAALVLV
jgi:hypothetical protein